MSLSEPIKEALKETGRMAIFAGVGIAVAYFTDLPQTETTVIALGILRAVDKVLHEQSKVKGSDLRVTGLVPF